MSIDTAFQPKGQTALVGTSAVQVIPPGTGPLGMVSFRCCNTAATVNRLGWGDTAAKTSAAAPTGSTQATVANSINIAIGGTVTLELPSSIFLIASAASVEVTPGQGATGS
jgi:hypothetical protein